MNNDSTDWIHFTTIDEEGEPEKWRVNLSFMLSNWTCLFGRGCPGEFGAQDSHTNPDFGCCGDGAYIVDTWDLEAVTERVAELTPEDWDEDLRKHVEKNGWYIERKNDRPGVEGAINGKTRVHRKACVFSNRRTGSVGSTGKTGCAFHHMAQRKGLDHVDVMPDVCWMVPINFFIDTHTNESVIDIWNREKWKGFKELPDGTLTQDHWLHWWCSESPEAIMGGDKYFYRSYERELRAVMGDLGYDAMVEEIGKRMHNAIAPLPVPLDGSGKPKLLPLYIGNRTPN